MPEFKKSHIILIALCCIVLFWGADAFIDSILFDGGELAQQLFSPTTKELWYRTSFALFLSLFTAFVCVVIHQRDRLDHQLKTALEEAAAERAKSEAIVAAIGDGISIQDTGLNVLYQNDVHRQMSGGNFIGMQCYSSYGGGDAPCPDCPIIAAFNDGGIHKLVKQTPAGSATTHIEIIASPLRDGNGNIVAGIEVVRDISSHMQSEARLKRKAAALESLNRELESFAHSVSHDLRKPLTVIYTAAHYLKENSDPGGADPSAYFINTICDASQRMEELIDSLQMLANISHRQINLTSLDLSELALVIAADLGLIYPERTVSCHIAPGLTAYGDCGLIRILLENLLGNAWKYTADTPSASIIFDRCDTVRGKGFFIRDNGAGFDMAFADNLFKPFSRLHDSKRFPGTGIGLATVKRVVERHGGQVWAEGRVGEGATFYFILPEGNG
ncbi:cyanobacterial phytochrome B [Geobacter sp. OR-1]|uniref:PAS domain-containing sensor histidine kinase n=1 Tax=Geobacter sp. OR-1 TaxID=1266765 RepID=UPI000541F911|nr:ATP-binding protein [Geobacter sp. OR-1]GAM08165.1 cyanobacterial phytochrome B [Geobacter sp. OR-1]